MTLEEVLCSEHVWVSVPCGALPEHCRVVGPAAVDQIAVLTPLLCVRLVLSADCFPTRREAVGNALEHARRAVLSRETDLRRHQANILHLERLATDPEPADTLEPAGARP